MFSSSLFQHTFCSRACLVPCNILHFISIIHWALFSTHNLVLLIYFYQLSMFYNVLWIFMVLHNSIYIYFSPKRHSFLPSNYQHLLLESSGHWPDLHIIDDNINHYTEMEEEEVYPSLHHEDMHSILKLIYTMALFMKLEGRNFCVFCMRIILKHWNFNSSKWNLKEIAID